MPYKGSQMAKLGSKESAANILESRMAVIRQWDKKEALAILIPQRIEGGKFYNFKGNVIMSHEGEDCTFHEDDSIINDANRVTDKLLNDVYKPINDYLGSSTERQNIAPIEEDEDEEETGPGTEVAEEEEVKAPKKDKKSKKDELDLIDEITSLIANKDLKAAKKLLKVHAEHDDFKKAKKIFKKAKGE